MPPGPVNFCAISSKNPGVPDFDAGGFDAGGFGDDGFDDDGFDDDGFESFIPIILFAAPSGSVNKDPVDVEPLGLEEDGPAPLCLPPLPED